MAMTVVEGEKTRNLNPPEAQLRNILELERRKGYADTAVMGGLDRFLKNLIQRDNLGPRSPITESIMALPSHGYASLSPAERQRWLAMTLSLLSGSVERPAATPTVQKARASVTKPKRQPARPPVIADAASSLERPTTALKGVSTGACGEAGPPGRRDGAGPPFLLPPAL